MKVYVGDILRQPGLSKSFNFTGKLELEGVNPAGNVEVSFKLNNASSRVLVSGIIKAPIILSCARCVENFTQDLEIEVHEEFLPIGSPELEDEKLGWDNLSIFSYSNDELDLLEIIRQNVIASIPIKPLCRENCKGLGAQFLSGNGIELASNGKWKVDSRLLPLLEIKNKEQ